MTWHYAPDQHQPPHESGVRWLALLFTVFLVSIFLRLF